MADVGALRNALLISTNGAGLGHLTRSLAIARRLSPALRPILFTQSAAVAAARKMGFFVEHVQAKHHARNLWDWRRSFDLRLAAVLDEYQPDVVLYEGTVLQPEVIRGVGGRIPLVWSRRGLRRHTHRISREQAGACEMILEPGDLADVHPRSRGPGELQRVEPILLCDTDEILPRGAAAEAAGVDADACNVLVQVGAGNTYSLDDALVPSLRVLRRRREVSVTMAVSPIRMAPPSHVDGARTLSAYPMSRLYRAFDFVITSCGYNSFHEMVAFSVPSLIIPNRTTGMDDQEARAEFAQRRGIARVWADQDESSLEAHVDHLLDGDERARLVEACGRLRWSNGAIAAARYLSSAAGIGTA